MKLTVLTYNTLFAGRDGSDDRRAQAQVELIQSVQPDIFLMQEARGYADDGQRRLFELEARLGMRGFLALAPRIGQHVAIFLRAAQRDALRRRQRHLSPRTRHPDRAPA